MRVDRRLSHILKIGKRGAKELIEAGRVRLDGSLVEDGAQRTDKFITLRVDEEMIYQKLARYVMLHKPKGVVSANRDKEFTTVMDLLGEQSADDLHISGRLDRNTTGLVILSNDGRWSRSLFEPSRKVAKVYEVQLDGELETSMIKDFERGFYFPTEAKTTRPAKLTILGPSRGRVVLEEGMYHQIKRMFSRVGRKVIALHRHSVGPYELGDLQEGQFRAIDPGLVNNF